MLYNVISNDKQTFWSKLTLLILIHGDLILHFIINDYNRIRIRQPYLSTPAAYLKAYNGKIVPILLTALSTVLGLLPFVVFDKNDPFWYSLAMCTIGGMVASVLVLVLVLPVFFGKR